jgi:hypothetical protein
MKSGIKVPLLGGARGGFIIAADLLKFEIALNGEGVLIFFK